MRPVSEDVARRLNFELTQALLENDDLKLTIDDIRAANAEFANGIDKILQRYRNDPKNRLHPADAAALSTISRKLEAL